MSCPSKSTAPADVSRRPVSIFAVVLLPDPFVTKITDYFTSTNLEADVVHDCGPEESFDEVSCFQHRSLHTE